MHECRCFRLSGQAGDKGTSAMFGLDNAAGAQQLEPFAQGRAGNAELLDQPPLRWQQLPGLQDAVDDQLFDAVGHHIGNLAGGAGALGLDFIHMCTFISGTTSGEEGIRIDIYGRTSL
jgi:hypothetical protein